MSDYLPQEVLIDILARLPVRSLLRFRCVSKSWCSLITSPSFITTHLNQTTSIANDINNSHSHLLLLRYFSKNLKKERYSLRFDNETLDKSVELKCPFKTRFYFRVVGCCNGLICLSDDWFGYTHTIILWNPAIQKCVDLPMPRVTFDAYGPYMFALGFGFDSRANDYKVVRIAYLRPQGSIACIGYKAPPEVEVYTLSTGSWKTISDGIPPYNMVEFIWSQAFVNGFVHWIAYYRSEEHGLKSVILSFDMGEEVFEEMKLPNMLANVSPLNLYVATVGDTLSLFQYENRLKGKRCIVWVMKEYGAVGTWSKQFTVDLEGGLGMSLGFRKNGELLLATRRGDMVSYHPENKRVQKLGIRGSEDSFYVGAYAESLVLLNGLNGDLQGQVKSCDAVSCEGDPVLPREEEGDEKHALERRTIMHYIFAASFLNV